jgi:hypothetical protein
MARNSRYNLAERMAPASGGHGIYHSTVRARPLPPDIILALAARECEYHLHNEAGRALTDCALMDCAAISEARQ